jgi:hypothetical protein
MENEKIVRSLCYFTNILHSDILEKVDHISNRLETAGFVVQTKRICSTGFAIKEISSVYNKPVYYLSIGTLDRESTYNQLHDFLNAENLSFNLDLSGGVCREDIDVLFNIIHNRPGKTFHFSYTFCNAPSSPYFPSADFERNGYSIGLQPTDLSEKCSSIVQWLEKVKVVWNELCDLFRENSDFLGIDSSIAPLYTGKSSLIHIIKKIYHSFSKTTTKALYLEISQFIKDQNPKPIGLCGIMFPCLEDFELAGEYEKGNFSIERNIYLSLHSGLGIDTYPIGIDESPEKVFEILSVLQGLAEKYRKPLSARFVSDGIAKIGGKTDLRNQYLKDVVVRPL